MTSHPPNYTHANKLSMKTVMNIFQSTNQPAQENETNNQLQPQL